MPPLITYTTIRLEVPTDDDRRAFDQRIRDGLSLPDLRIPLSVLRKARIPAPGERELACVIADTAQTRTLIDVGTDRSCSIALDLGTTNLVATLYDNRGRRELLTRSLENPQIAFGSDILTRMHHVLSGSRTEVYDALRTGVNDLIGSLCRESGIGRADIHALSAAGNTVMSHFFLGLDISTIPVAPFVPAVRSPGFHAARELGLDVHPEAPVYLFPNAGSYVGGDITAGILASGMFRDKDTSILIDVGTNAEVVIGNREWMIVGAGAAGPALEEGITRIGRRAKRGIVYDVSISGDHVECRTFDGARPEGICGSGMVSLLAELRRTGMVDQSGMLTAGRHIAEIDGERAFVIACDGGDALHITQGEIANFMRSKAAMFTLLLVLTRSVGISFRDIGRVFVSGALGTGIDAPKAAAIGMLPAWPAERVKPLGNSSLAGCRMLLEDGSLGATVDDIASRITYKHMHDDPEFMKEFLGAVFLPHTDPALLQAT